MRETDIIERYIHDVRNARAVLADPHATSRYEVAQTVIADVTIYCADHIEDVQATRTRLVLRTDFEGRALLATLDTLLLSLRTAQVETTAALEKARRR